MDYKNTLDIFRQNLFRYSEIPLFDTDTEEYYECDELKNKTPVNNGMEYSEQHAFQTSDNKRKRHHIHIDISSLKNNIVKNNTKKLLLVDKFNNDRIDREILKRNVSEYNDNNIDTKIDDDSNIQIRNNDELSNSELLKQSDRITKKKNTDQNTQHKNINSRVSDTHLYTTQKKNDNMMKLSSIRSVEPSPVSKKSNDELKKVEKDTKMDEEIIHPLTYKNTTSRKILKSNSSKYSEDNVIKETSNTPKKYTDSKHNTISSVDNEALLSNADTNVTNYIDDFKEKKHISYSENSDLDNDDMSQSARKRLKSDPNNSSVTKNLVSKKLRSTKNSSRIPQPVESHPIVSLKGKKSDVNIKNKRIQKNAIETDDNIN
ncbi:hypothetical protein EON71_00435 [bacterium]|nr:MAG: hypothetical protein EON71_00435 [bacterium]